MNDFYERSRNEQVELRDKIEKLRAFIWDGNSPYGRIGGKEINYG